MTVSDWTGVIDQLADMGTADVQFIGGEPTLYPHLRKLITHAHGAGLAVEVFSNLTHVRPELWETFKECGVKLATSYYSATPQEHDKVTNLRGSHRKTRANIKKALDLGLQLRGGIVSVQAGQRVHEAQRDLAALGVPEVGADRTRAFGRASRGAQPTINDLCGHCAQGKGAIGPNGDVWPCVLSRFLTTGNVRETPIAEVWAGARMSDVRRELEAVHDGRGAQACTPPQFLPMCGPCQPCPPMVGHCDPREADSPPAKATISAPA
ncbi:radical SAM protein [Streptomyces eurocidicus]|uniref:Radical SAM protein n=2 Tax=Streptomyces eurocidicus TaxID=66423 RepID=A0A2N8NRQ8_STREU|nr:radical SAM protein with 4Fe4S-binding SPASM domain [Streptomyces eurocidicus]PNE31454.1 radical SAM protein [Streptomyces eurocidicus]